MVARLLFALVCALWMATANAATFTAAIDRNELYQDEHLALTLRLENSDTRLRAEGISPNIDLTLLTDNFDLGPPRTSNRFNIERSYGRSTSELIVDLFPKHSGTLTIPPFEIDGIKSNALTVKVLPPVKDKSPEVFVRADVSKYDVWQREQLVAYADLYHRVELSSAKIGGQIETQPLNIQLRHLPESERTETVNGVEYQVLRTAWAIFPLLDGQLTIRIPDIWVVTSKDEKLRFPFATKIVGVKALPAAVPANMVVGKPELAIAPLNDNYATGKLASWNITLRAPVDGTALPEHLPALELPENLKPYTGEASRDVDNHSDGLTGIATYTLSLIPLQPGHYQLPAIQFPYFDTARGIMDVATVNGPMFEVTGVPHSNTGESAFLSSASGTTPLSANDNQTITPWQIAAGVFALLWLATMTAWRYTKKRSVTDHKFTPIDKPRPFAIMRHHPLRQRLLDALRCRSLEQGLTAYEDRYGIDEELREIVLAVQRLCYSRNKNVDESTLRNRVETNVKKIRGRKPEPPNRENVWSPHAFRGSI